MNKICSAIFLLVLLSVSAHASTYHVATTGNDAVSCVTAETIGTPKATIAAGILCAGAHQTDNAAGDTVLVAAGTYEENLVNVMPSGTAGNYFNLTCSSTRNCIIDAGDYVPGPLSCDDGTPYYGFLEGGTGSHYWNITGFVFAGDLSFAISGGRVQNTHHDIGIYNNEMRDNVQGDGMSLSGTRNVTLQGNWIHGNGQVPGPPCDPDHEGFGYKHGVYLSSANDFLTFSGNEIEGSKAYGLHIYDDMEEDWMTDSVIENNYFHDNGTAGRNGSGMVAYGYRLTIKNNISSNNVYLGIQLDAVGQSSVYNNTTYSNGTGGITMYSGVSTSCRNNLMIEEVGTPIVGCSTISDNWSTGAASAHFVDAAAENFALISSSAAIDIGADLSGLVDEDYVGTARPFGSDYDIGAYEYDSGGGGAGGPIVVISSSAGTSDTNPSGGTETRSFNNTATSFATLIGIVHTNAASAVGVSGVTFNGDALTRQGGHSADPDYGAVDAWYRVAPDVATGNVVATIGAGLAAGLSIIALEGVDQASPFGDTDSAAGTGTLSTTLALSTITGNLVLSCITVREGTGGSSAIGTLTPTDGGTAMTEIDMFNGNMRGRCQYKFASSSTTNISWSWTASSSWDHYALVVRADTTSGGGGMGNIRAISNYLRKNQN